MEGFLAYLNLQELVVTTNSLVVHLMVCIIGITTAFIFNKSKPTISVNEIRVDCKVNRDYSQTACSSARSRDVTTNKSTIAIASHVSFLCPTPREGALDKAVSKANCKNFDSPVLEELGS